MVMLAGLALLTAVVVAMPSSERGPAKPVVQGEPRRPSCVGVNLTSEVRLQAALEAAPEGTTFCLAAGVYRLTESLVPKRGSILWGEPGAVLNGSRLVYAARPSDQGWLAPGTADAVFFDDRPLRPATSLDDLGPGRFFNDTANGVVHFADDPAGRKVEIPVAQGAVSAFREKEARRDNVTLRTLVIEKFTGAAAITSGWNWTIDGAEVRWNQSVGINVSSNNVVRNSRIHHNGHHGFLGYSLSNLTIEGNDISDNSRAQSMQEGAGGKVIVSDNVVFRKNQVHNNLGPGLIDWDNVNVVYDSNLLRQNTGPGISQYGSAGSVIRDNTFEHNGLDFPGQPLQIIADLWITNAKDADIVGNTITAGVNGIGIVDVGRQLSARGQAEVRNVHVHGNTIRMPDAGLTGLVGDRKPAFRTANNRFEDNHYYVTDIAVISFLWDGPRNWNEWQGQGQDVKGGIQTWVPQ
jgi:parallel beta-helix repeat protein